MALPLIPSGILSLKETKCLICIRLYFINSKYNNNLNIGTAFAVLYSRLKPGKGFCFEIQNYLPIFLSNEYTKVRRMK